MFKRIAHNSTFPALAAISGVGTKDLKPLQDVIAAEKAVIVSLQRLTADFDKASEALRAWGLGEGDDLGDILSASTTIITHFTAALSQYASHGHTMREHLKSIRTLEEDLGELKNRHRSLISKAESQEKKIRGMNSEHKNYPSHVESLNQLHRDIRDLDLRILKDEAGAGNFKRKVTRSWLALKFGGLLEWCEKGAIVGEYGKLIVSEIPQDEAVPGQPRNPYFGRVKVGELTADTHRRVNEVRLSTDLSPPHLGIAGQYSSQAAGMTESHSTNQGRFGSPSQFLTQVQTPTNLYHDDVLRRDGLYDSRHSGPTHFLASSTDINPTEFSGSFSGTSVSQTRSGPVDEFGVTPSGFSDSSTGGGGRFATFPLKPQGQSGISQYHSQRDAEEDDNSLSLLAAPPPRKQSDSFSSSVAQALASSDSTGDEGAQSPSLPEHPRHQSNDDSVPSYREANPWGSGGPGAWPGTTNASTPEPQLAYVQDEGSPRLVSRHVRFGEVREIDDNPLPPITPQEPSFSSETPGHKPGQNEDFKGSSSSLDRRENRLSPEKEEQALNAAAAREIALELHSTSSSSTAHGPSGLPSPLTGADSGPPTEMSPLVPPTASYMVSDRKSVSPRPPFDVSSTDASTVSRGIFSDPPSPGPVPAYTEEPSSVIQPPYDAVQVGPGPAATISSSPQQTLYQGQTQALPGQESLSSTHTRTQLSQLPLPPQHDTSVNYLSDLSPEPEFNPYEEQAYQERSRGTPMSSPAGFADRKYSKPLPQLNTSPPTQPRIYSSNNPPSPGGPRVGISARSSGHEPKSYGSMSPLPPLEQPNAPYMRPDIGNRSTPSLNSPGGGSGGKISAAAFKRPSPRLGGPGSPFISPSSSPFPSGGRGQSRLSPTEGKRLPSPYESDLTPAPGQSIKPLHIKKRETQDLDAEQFDYIAAYVNSGGDDHGRSPYGQGQEYGSSYDGEGKTAGLGTYHAEQEQRAASASAAGGGWAGIGSGGGAGAGGYEQGKFTTNLEHEGSR